MDIMRAPEQFFDLKQAMQELRSLGFAVSSIVETFPKGSHERENAKNALRGIEYRVSYLAASFERIRELKLAEDVANKLTEKLGGVVGGAIGAGQASGPTLNQLRQEFLKSMAVVESAQWSPEQLETLRKEISKPYEQAQADRLCGKQIVP